MADKNRAEIFFYPARKLRDRQIDTVRHWPANSGKILNRENFQQRKGVQASKPKTTTPRINRSLKQRIPLPNIKRRPKEAPRDAIVYAWGSIVSHGPFITEIDNPYALTGYNPFALRLYRNLFRWYFLSDSCREFRCISYACKATVRAELGADVADKARVIYPYAKVLDTLPRRKDGSKIKFLSIGSQFEIKGGPSLLRTFRKAHQENPNIHLDFITHLPPEYEELADHPAITIHPPRFSREELHRDFFQQSDVLLHPTFIDSFGMVVLEAISAGMAVIATPMYALPEMVMDSGNGFLIEAPYNHWNGPIATPEHERWHRSVEDIRKCDTIQFEEDLLEAIVKISKEPGMVENFRKRSLTHAHWLQQVSQR